LILTVDEGDLLLLCLLLLAGLANSFDKVSAMLVLACSEAAVVLSLIACID
jgi:hypothetical protein